MSSNLYLFDPKQAQAQTAEKPLIQIMREAELARSEESARIIKRFAQRISGLFGSKKSAPVADITAKPVANTVKTPAEEERLAA